MRLFFVMIIFLSLLVSEDYIPKNYYKYDKILYSEIEKTFPSFLVPSYFAALIEHENCINLKWNSCWNAETQLYTKWKNGLPREQGVGFGQITRAWRSNGSLRFDTLTNLVRKYPKELKELTWDNIKKRPDLQFKAMILLYKTNFNLFVNKGIDYYSMMAFSDYVYNGGYKSLYKDMQVCKLKVKCNPKVWFDNVETTVTKSTKILYGNRSAKDIVIHHVHDVLENNLMKYTIEWDKAGYNLKPP